METCIFHEILLPWMATNREYLTYKEWKLEDRCPLKVNASSFHSDCEYLTYKEWKHYIQCKSGKEFATKGVSPFPIRNETQPVFWYICWFYLTFKQQKNSSTILDTTAFYSSSIFYFLFWYCLLLHLFL